MQDHINLRNERLASHYLPIEKAPHIRGLLRDPTHGFQETPEARYDDTVQRLEHVAEHRRELASQPQRVDSEVYHQLQPQPARARRNPWKVTS